MKITKKESVEQEVVVDVFCNKCKKSLCHDRGVYGINELTIHGGYGSTSLEDLTSYTFSLCEECLKRISFEIPVETKDHW